MSEYIEREKLLEELEKIPAYFDSGDTRYGVEIAIDQIKKQPTADVVKIVRCKDCEFVQPTLIKINGKDLKTCELYKRPCYDNDFCSKGLSKECEEDVITYSK